MDTQALKITIKTLYGFEEILKDEVMELGFTNVEVLNRAVQVTGTWKDVYILNFKLRLAISVLVEVEKFHIHSEDDLYKKAKQIDWTSYFDIDKTFSVKGAVFSTLFNHTGYPFLVVKDAIVDVFRDKLGDRPNVNLKAPQVVFDVYVKEKAVTISLNTSGVPLFQRGYRQETGEAPMNEVLAAGLLKLSGWDKKSALVDPMCGSGTLVIEAALMAADIPSMIERQHYAFKNFKSYDETVWEEVYNSANRRPIKLDFPIIGSDIDAEVLQKAKRNSRCAPIGNMISFELGAFDEQKKPAEKGTLICNPPYGERMGDEIIELYQSLGDFFKQEMTGFDCWVVTSNLEAAKFIGLKPEKKHTVYNGSLECTFRKFSIFEGSKRIKSEKEDGAVDESSTGLTVTEPRKERIKKEIVKPERAKRAVKPREQDPEPEQYKSPRTNRKSTENTKEEETIQPVKYKSFTGRKQELTQPTHEESIEDNPIDEGKEMSNNKHENKEESTSTPRPIEETNKSKLSAMRKYRTRNDD